MRLRGYGSQKSRGERGMRRRKGRRRSQRLLMLGGGGRARGLWCDDAVLFYCVLERDREVQGGEMIWLGFRRGGSHA